MINSVTIAGYIGQKPELKMFESGSIKVTFSLAVNYVTKEAEKTSWIPVECWNGQATFVNNYLDKGSYIVVQGRLQEDKWIDSEGNNKSRLYVVANSVESPKSNQGNSSNNNTKKKTQELEDLPY
jgi:single-strand DNA-binding protein